MASSELVLLNLFLDRGMVAFREAVRYGLAEGWFRDPDFRDLWLFIEDHVRRYGDVPTERTVREAHPSFATLSLPQNENVRAVLDRLQVLHYTDELNAILHKLHNQTTRHPLDVLQMIHDKAKKVLSRSARSIVSSMSSEEAVDASCRLYMGAKEGGTNAIRLPWPSIDSRTMGLAEGEFVCIYGNAKSMKTFMALYIAVYNYITRNARVLVISREMPEAQMRTRIHAMMARVNLSMWQHGQLPEDEEERMFSYLAALPEINRTRRSIRQPTLPPGIFVCEPKHDRFRGMELVRFLLDEFQPDLVVDDSIYRASRTEGESNIGWEFQVSTSQEVKDIAVQYRIPYVVTSQAKVGVRPHPNPIDEVTRMDNFAFSGSFVQDCDLIIRTLPMDTFLLLGFPAYRSGALPDAIAIEAAPCTSFEEIDEERFPHFSRNHQLAADLYRKTL